MLNFNLFARRTTKKTKNNKTVKKIHEPVLFLYSVDKCPLCYCKSQTAGGRRHTSRSYDVICTAVHVFIDGYFMYDTSTQSMQCDTCNGSLTLVLLQIAKGKQSLY